MALHQLVLFLLFLLCGRSDCTVSVVAVQEGQSVVIPCLYQKEGEDHDKLWCRNHPHRGASTVNTTDIQSAAQVSIYDDITQSVFTVNMMNVRREDTGRYCCATKPKEAKEHKDLYCLEMTITDGPSKLHVPSQMVSGQEGGTVTVHVQHGFSEESKKMWCRLGGECVGWDTQSGPLDGMTVTLSDTAEEVRVTLSGLQERNTGWYYCSMGGFQIPVHLNVTPLSVTPLSVTPLSVTSAKPLTVNESTSLQQHEMPVLLLLACPAGFLLLLGAAAAAVCLARRWRHGSRKGPQETSASTNSATADPEVIYADVRERKRRPRHPNPADPADHVLYSTLRAQVPLAGGNANPEELTYSSIRHQTRSKSREKQLPAAEETYSGVRVHHK